MAIKGEIVKEYLKKFPDTGNLTLAKLIYDKNLEVFTGVEDVRSTLRYYRGSCGVKLRESITDKSNFKDLSEFRDNPYRIPKGDKNDYSPYEIPKANKKALIFSDAHVPYHNEEVLTVLFDQGLKENVDTVIINGDFLDFYQLSRFERDPRERSVRYELETGREILKIIRDAFPSALIVYVVGNHEQRYESFLRLKAPELLDIEEFRLDILLKLRDLNIQFVTDKRMIKFGKLNVIHGHEFGHQVFSPVNPARGFYMRAKTNVLGGHHHQSSEHIEPNMNGESIGAWSIGCTSELHPRYFPLNRWGHGGAITEITDDRGNFKVDNMKIIRGKIY
jgi:predicted phosphodiesterase